MTNLSALQNIQCDYSSHFSFDIPLPAQLHILKFYSSESTTILQIRIETGRNYRKLDRTLLDYVATTSGRHISANCWTQPLCELYVEPPPFKIFASTLYSLQIMREEFYSAIEAPRGFTLQLMG